MKNILIFDDCQDYFYNIHSVSTEYFKQIFPDPDQDVEFHDDLFASPDLENLNPVFQRLWFNRRSNAKVVGLHAMLFYENWDRKPYYPGKRDIAHACVTLAAPVDRGSKIVLVVDRVPSEPIVACSIDAKLFGSLFLRPRQDVLFFEDLVEGFGASRAQTILRDLRGRVIAKSEAPGIDATLYVGYPERRMYFPTRIDADVPRHYPLKG